MRPEDAFWVFLKSDWRRMKDELGRMKRQKPLMQPRKPYTRPYTQAEKDELRAQLARQLGSDSLTPEDDDPLYQMNRITTTPSTENVDEPTPGTGFDTLTEEQKRNLKYRRGGS